MSNAFLEDLQGRLQTLDDEGLTKPERVIASPQDGVITLSDGSRVRNFCANNYLGLADHPDMQAAAASALASRGFGMASVRFICGTQNLHKELESRLASFFGFDTPSSIPPASMPMGVCLRLCWGKKTPLFPMP